MSDFRTGTLHPIKDVGNLQLVGFDEFGNRGNWDYYIYRGDALIKRMEGWDEQCAIKHFDGFVEGAKLAREFNEEQAKMRNVC